jgi:hypothetical protein
MAAKKNVVKIEIPPLKWDRMKLRLVGASPLIIRNFDDKTKAEIAAKQAKEAAGPQAARDPEADFERARLLDAKGKDCVRALWIKCACVDAARFLNVKMTELRGALFVEGDLLRIEYKKMRMRTDSVRVGGGTASLAYRPEYTEWAIPIVVRYRPELITPAGVINLLNNAGQSIGLGERRPAQNGDQFGMFEVEQKKIEKVA